MASLAEWVEGARPRTLPASIAPVLGATGLAIGVHHFRPLLAVLAGVVSLALQVGVNYANDYSDGIRGTDEDRVGPLRLVGSRLASPRAVRLAAVVAFGVAGVAGVVICAIVSWWLLLVGAVSIVAAWLYTGGKHPYGYYGFGEVFVFIFFGLVATLGAYYVQVLAVSPAAIAVAVGFGSFITAILVANNLRDIPGDTQSGKRTLAVRMGDGPTRIFYTVLMLVGVAMFALALGWSWWLLSVLILCLLLITPLRAVFAHAEGRALIPVLAGTSRMTLVAGLLGLVVFSLMR
ncbi:MAG: 1,4-dihydroxy-2-naphthoate polyprenyltransferase [Ferrimicrobium sp.]|uniref:1,4-dihydroxy-2-naphthoate polyprenyltransferase n=1 Tax=Ferrimicrobium sp. TaxID=2926050 RepID=UPI0026126B27|nr:1,4-dihydroxy-2-naphthoate polyprenyltransferase [Ferrimicrobium sp.]